MRLLPTICAASVTALLPIAANAATDSTLGARSSGTVGITVEIPPVAAAIDAANAGAVGLWTVTDSQSAFMINLPSALSEKDGAAYIFHGPGTTVSATVDPNPFVSLAAETSSQLNGMKREAFRLTRLTSPTQPALAAPVVTMLVSSL